MSPFFSVIVPLYNREDIIDRTLNSVIEQSVCKEIIIVDDCSTDNSLAKVKEYSKKYDHIRVITHDNNLGAGGARNSGVSVAQGEYILFLDSDDWFEDGAFIELKKEIEANNQPDLVVFSFNRVGENNQIITTENKKLENNKGRYSGRSIFESFVQGIINPSPWNKAYKCEFWRNNKFRFAEKMPHDDFVLMPYISRKAQTATILNSRLYNYFEHSSNITNSISDYKIECSTLTAVKMRENILNDSSISDVYEDDLNRIAYKHFHSGFRARRKLCSDKQIKNWIWLIIQYNATYKVSTEFIHCCDRARMLFALFFLETKERGIAIETFFSDSEAEKKELMQIIDIELGRLKMKKGKSRIFKCIKSSILRSM